jgi:hypothetical protein
MGRHLFLAGMADWATDLGADETSVNSQAGIRALFIPDATITFYDAQTGGTPITDLLDALDTPITSVAADDSGEFPQIQGPDTDPETWSMWADGNGGAGPRRLVVATDIGDAVTEVRNAVADLSSTADALNTMARTSLGVVRYDTATSSWPARPDGDQRFFAWFGPTAPPAGDPYMLDGELWFNTSPA